MAKYSALVVAEIDRVMGFEKASGTYRVLVEYSGEHSYAGPFTSDEIAIKLYCALNDPSLEGIVRAARAYKQPMFLGRFVQLLTNETHLANAEQLVLAISEISKETFRARDLERVKLWWKSHQNTYTNWPYDHLDEGITQFKKIQYASAVKEFEEVLRFDPAADMSRSLATACYWETGETNKAAKLVKEFKGQSTRWSKWAEAKTELETGNVSNATVKMVNLATNYPPTLFYPMEGSHIWRKADWRMFREMTKGSTL
jgi:tetratricopeptide (TPR) repeat protein